MEKQKLIKEKQKITEAFIKIVPSFLYAVFGLIISLTLQLLYHWKFLWLVIIVCGFYVLFVTFLFVVAVVVVKRKERKLEIKEDELYF
jgi:membrane protein YdbS with pleckstrin-like domain